MEGLFLSVSRPLLPNYILASITTKLFEICTGGSNLTGKNSVWRIFEKFEFLRERDGPKVCTFGSTLNLRYRLRIAKFQKMNMFHEKL